MALYGYGIDMDEADRLEENDFRRKWQAEKRRVAESTPAALRSQLVRVYNTVIDGGKITPYDFIDYIAWRIYTEGCMNKEIIDPDHYQGETLINYIDREIYFASERLSYRGVAYSQEEIREYVLESLVKRTNELFTEWHGTIVKDRNFFPKKFAAFPNKSTTKREILMSLTIQKRHLRIKEI